LAARFVAARNQALPSFLIQFQVGGFFFLSTKIFERPKTNLAIRYKTLWGFLFLRNHFAPSNSQSSSTFKIAAISQHVLSEQGARINVFKKLMKITLIVSKIKDTQ
jgi:hypothetical protein